MQDYNNMELNRLHCILTTSTIILMYIKGNMLTGIMLILNVT